MNADEMRLTITSRLYGLLLKNELVLTETIYDRVRQKTVLRWASSSLSLEIYSDPQGNEVNCRIAKAGNDDECKHWQFLFKYVPLSERELHRAHSTFMPLEEQLELVLTKLEIFLERWSQSSSFNV